MTAAIALLSSGAVRLAHFAGFGPTDRPPRAWSTPLVVLVALALLAQVGDVVTSIALLGDPARPYAIEANPLMAAVINQAGLAGLALIKLAGALLVVGLVHYSLRRGLPKTAYGLAAASLLVGALLTALNGMQLAIPPLPPELLDPGLSI